MALNNGKNVAAENRRHQAIQMKMGGDTIDQISETLGVSRTQAHNDIRRRLKEVRREDVEAVQEEYQMQKMRYERLLLRWWNQATGADVDSAERASNMCLKILRQIDYIGGLIPDKPVIQLQQNLQFNNNGATFADLLREARGDEIVEGTLLNGYNGSSSNGH